MPLTFIDQAGKEVRKEVPVSTWNHSASSDDKSRIRETDTQSYIRITTFGNFSNDDSSDTTDKFLEKFAAYGKQARKKKIIIIDLRGNHGGSTEYTNAFLKGLCGKKIPPYGGEVQQWSPAITQGYLFILQQMGYNSQSKETAAVLKQVKHIASEMKNNPVTYTEEHGLINLPSDFCKKEIESYKGTIILITDRNEASSSEDVAFYLKNADNVTRIGENTEGCFAGADNLIYVLPHSKANITLPCKRFASASVFPNKLDDGNGFMPDYWVTSDEELYDTLKALGIDDHIIGHL